MERMEIDLTDSVTVRRFIERSDKLGGPDTDATKRWWQQVQCVVPGRLREQVTSLDPLSPAYFELQEQLYAAIYGRSYTDLECELTPFDQEQALRGLTAYPNWSPARLNRYFGAMTRLADLFDAEGPSDILELGSGWGFSAEYMARLWHRVVAVDSNSDFIAVAARRSAVAGLGIDYRQGTFESPPLRPDESFDVIFCFEAFHHCRHPLIALQVLRQALRPEGRFILAGEPFIDPAMWPAWGLRTDPLSIYCIAKFGWWESGWTVVFMADLFRRVQLQMSFVDFHSDLERYMIGRAGNVAQDPCGDNKRPIATSQSQPRGQGGHSNQYSADLHAQLAAQNAYAARLESELSAVYRSTSWRVTAPLRRLKSWTTGD